MEITDIPFTSIDWSTIPAEQHSGERGMAFWRVQQCNNMRLRMVEYTPGYVADHWCTRGHLIFCLEGELITELKNGSLHTMHAGMCHVLSDGEPAHRSHTDSGVKLLIVD
jgi:hypothetical protein